MAVKPQSGRLIEWLVPLAFIIASGWAIWHIPAYILDLNPPESPTLLAKLTGALDQFDVTPNMPGLFGGRADALDWVALIAIPVLFVFGVRNIRCAAMEYEDWRWTDRVALFIGRVTMMLILAMTAVMLYEVFLRYFLEKPTKWANELTLWMAGFVFLCSGLYAMQQRCHIRIFLLYDVVPRWLQRVFDILSTLFICIFAFALVYGGFTKVFLEKLLQWEAFGSAFNPPIPATLQPAILIVCTLIAIQSVLNLINDWNAEPEKHTAASDIDADELEALKRSVGKT